MKKRSREQPEGDHRPGEQPDSRKATVQGVRKRAKETVENRAVARMRAHLLKQLGVRSLQEAMQDEDNVHMLCAGVWSPEEVGSELFAEMLMAAVESSKEHAQLVLESLEDLNLLAEGDEADKAAVERAATAAREKYQLSV